MAGDGLLESRTSKLTLRAVAAAALILSILGGLYAFLHYVQVHLKQYPFLVLLFPPSAMASMAVVIPLMMFITYQDDFKNLNPLNPVHLFYISKRCYTAMARNNMKVAEKDL